MFLLKNFLYSNTLTTMQKIICLRNDFRQFEVIGTKFGGFGKVFKLKCKNDNKIYALKTIKHELFIKNKFLVKQFEREARLWMKMEDNINILKPILIDTIGVSKVGILMNYYAFSLRDVIFNKNHISNTDIINICLQIINGMLFLHEKENLIHRDLKPENIMIDNNGMLKITDFGMCFSVDNGGTLPYMAPEQHSSRKPCKAWDVFSFGIILYELITKKLPYPLNLFYSKSTSAFCQFKMSGGVQQEVNKISHQIPKLFFNILNGCLAIKTVDRFSDFNQIKRML